MNVNICTFICMYLLIAEETGRTRKGGGFLCDGENIVGAVRACVFLLKKEIGPIMHYMT